MSVTAAGPPAHLGRAYGEAAAQQIRSAVDFYSALSCRPGSGLNGAEARLGPYLDAARDSLPHLVEEMEGIAAGAGVDPAAVALINCIEEVEAVESCTTMVHGPFLLHAEQWYAGHRGVTVMRAEPEESPAFLSPCSPGCLPAVGLSEAGFAQGIDSLTSPDDRIGIPRVFVSRLALGASSLAAAVQAAGIDGRAGGYAHVLHPAEAPEAIDPAFSSTDRSETDHWATKNRGAMRAEPARGAVMVETTATSAEVLTGVIVHTNHYIAHPEQASPGSLARARRAHELLATRPPSTLEDCASVLADHGSDPQSICLHEPGFAGTATVFGMACDVTTGHMLVSAGPPCEGNWHAFELPALRGAAGVG